MIVVEHYFPLLPLAGTGLEGKKKIAQSIQGSFIRPSVKKKLFNELGTYSPHAGMPGITSLPVLCIVRGSDMSIQGPLSHPTRAQPATGAPAPKISSSQPTQNNMSGVESDDNVMFGGKCFSSCQPANTTPVTIPPNTTSSLLCSITYCGIS